MDYSIRDVSDFLHLSREMITAMTEGYKAALNL